MSELPLPRRPVTASGFSARPDRAPARAALLARAWQNGPVIAPVVQAAEAVRRDRLASGAPSWRRPGRLGEIRIRRGFLRWGGF
jgi:hypothetical protein